MGIIGRFKRLISGVSAEPVKQVVVTGGTAPQTQPQQFLQTTSQQSPQTLPKNDTRTLLKEATALKRAKHYDEAVAMLRRAYQTTPGPMIAERLRLPMYLQLAGRADEGWGEMNRLNITYVDQSSQITIAAHMAAFLRKEGKYKNTALFEVYGRFSSTRNWISTPTPRWCIWLTRSPPATRSGKRLACHRFRRGEKPGPRQAATQSTMSAIPL